MSLTPRQASVSMSWPFFYGLTNNQCNKVPPTSLASRVLPKSGRSIQHPVGFGSPGLCFCRYASRPYLWDIKSSLASRQAKLGVIMFHSGGTSLSALPTTRLSGSDLLCCVSQTLLLGQVPTYPSQIPGPGRLLPFGHMVHSPRGRDVISSLPSTQQLQHRNEDSLRRLRSIEAVSLAPILPPTQKITNILKGTVPRETAAHPYNDTARYMYRLTIEHT
ncbi:hypothetical protein V8F06_003979 [Rhypophila decipiens]